MRQFIHRLWQWLRGLLGLEEKHARQDEVMGDEAVAAGEAPVAAPAPAPVTLPPPLPPQMDIHAGEVPQFGRKASLLSRNEGKLYHSLLLALRSDYQIMAKVRLWDILWLVNEPPDRKQHLSRLSCRHVDFLPCEPQTLRPLLAIELDDASHRNPYAQENDRYKNEVFAAAGLPLLRLPHASFPPRQLRNRIESVLDGEQTSG